MVQPRSLVLPSATAGAALAAALGLRLRDPHTSGSFGTCPFLAITGLQCPGCGGLRAVNDLTHGDVGAALSSNLLAVVLVGVLVVAWLVWVVRQWRGHRGRMIVLSERWGYVVLATMAVFAVVRNLPFAAGLAP